MLGKSHEQTKEPDKFQLRMGLDQRTKLANLYQAALITEKVRGNARIAIHRYQKILKMWPADEQVVALSAIRLSELEY